MRLRLSVLLATFLIAGPAWPCTQQCETFVSSVYPATPASVDGVVALRLMTICAEKPFFSSAFEPAKGTIDSVELTLSDERGVVPGQTVLLRHPRQDSERYEHGVVVEALTAIFESAAPLDPASDYALSFRMISGTGGGAAEGVFEFATGDYQRVPIDAFAGIDGFSVQEVPERAETCCPLGVGECRAGARCVHTGWSYEPTVFLDFLALESQGGTPGFQYRLVQTGVRSDKEVGRYALDSGPRSITRRLRSGVCYRLDLVEPNGRVVLGDGVVCPQADDLVPATPPPPPPNIDLECTPTTSADGDATNAEPPLSEAEPSARPRVETTSARDRSSGCSATQLRSGTLEFLGGALAVGGLAFIRGRQRKAEG